MFVQPRFSKPPHPRTHSPLISEEPDTQITNDRTLQTESVRHEGPWRGTDDLELTTLKWVWWFNEVRLRGEIDHIRPT